MANNHRKSKPIILQAIPQWVLICAATFLLTSCIAQKLPSHKTGYGLIAVPYQVRNQSTYPLVKTIELKSSSSGNFSIRLDMPPFNDDVVVSQPIPEGSYLVDHAIAVFVPVPGVLARGTQGREDFADPVRIDITDGDMVLFPMLFTADQYTHADLIICRIGHNTLDSEKKRYYLEKLPTMENADQWRVRSAP